MTSASKATEDSPQKNTKMKASFSMEISHHKADYMEIDEMPTNVWDDYWEQSEIVHKKLLMNICQKNNKRLS